jgi:hypothetical protein
VRIALQSYGVLGLASAASPGLEYVAKDDSIGIKGENGLRPFAASVEN